MTADRPPLPYAWDDLRARLQADIRPLLDRLGLRNEGARNEGCIFPRNPTRADRRAGSFVVWTAPAAAGAWRDYATGEAGDVFDLVAYVERLAGKMDAYWWAVDFLGLDRHGHAGTPRSKAADIEARERRERERLAAEARRLRVDGEMSGALFKLWLGLPPSIEGTPAERYLREVRGIPMERLGYTPGALRWCREAEFIEPGTGEVKTWRNCMVAAMTRGTKVVGVHRTYLRADGSAKADLAKTKLMRGQVRGAAIRLSAGKGGHSPTKAAKLGRLGPLAIGEGIETCLTVACARPDYRVWAAGSLSLMGLLDWPDCASAVVLLGENDQGAEARAAFERVVAHWRGLAKGRPVEVVASRVGSDFNDWARA